MARLCAMRNRNVRSEHSPRNRCSACQTASAISWSRSSRSLSVLV